MRKLLKRIGNYAGKLSSSSLCDYRSYEIFNSADPLGEICLSLQELLGENAPYLLPGMLFLHRDKFVPGQGKQVELLLRADQSQVIKIFEWLIAHHLREDSLAELDVCLNVVEMQKRVTDYRDINTYKSFNGLLWKRNDLKLLRDFDALMGKSDVRLIVNSELNERSPDVIVIDDLKFTIDEIDFEDDRLVVFQSKFKQRYIFLGCMVIHERKTLDSRYNTKLSFRM